MASLGGTLQYKFKGIIIYIVSEDFIWFSKASDEFKTVK